MHARTHWFHKPVSRATCLAQIGSYLGLPLSTTHCQVGATTGVALLEGKQGVNYFVLGKTAIGWVITLIVVGFSTGLFVAQGLHAPIASGIQNDFLEDRCDDFTAAAVLAANATSR